MEERLLLQFNRLLIGERKRYIEQTKNKRNEVKYMTVKRTLTDKVVLSHICGERTIGIFYVGAWSKFLCFDIDDRNPEKVFGLLHLLEGVGFPAKDLHVENSGNKGYHIWLFSSEPIYITVWLRLGMTLVAEMGSLAEGIELRPESVNGKAIKLPLGVQKKTNINTVFLSYTLEPLDSPYDYFLSIVPMQKAFVEQTIQEAVEFYESLFPLCDPNTKTETPIEPLKPPLKPLCSVASKANRLRKEGMNTTDMQNDQGRHYNQFYVALSYKAQGYSQEKTTQAVIAWALNERKYGRVESSEEKLKRDITRDVKHIFLKNKTLFTERSKEIELYEADIQLAQNYYNIKVRKIVWGILLLGRMFHTEGIFFFSQRQLVEMTRIPKSNVHRLIHGLLAEGILVVVCKGNRNEATIYSLPHLIESPKCRSHCIEVSTYQELFESTFALTEKR